MVDMQAAGDPRGPAAQYAHIGRTQYDAVVADFATVKEELRALLAHSGCNTDEATCATYAAEMVSLALIAHSASPTDKATCAFEVLVHCSVAV